MNVVMGDAEEVWIKKEAGKRRELGWLPADLIRTWAVVYAYIYITFCDAGRILLKGDNIVSD